ncbi:MAG: hypothetical protein KDC61_02385 [Saprospiraceae bacterium]|nr:hypothetical protein [Flavobacteriales bacterium]MCB0573399.1 hypothetical protein [Saprospiraceae bacterium]
MYYIWRQDWNFYIESDWYLPDEWNRYSLFMCEKIPVDLPPVTFEIKETIIDIPNVFVNFGEFIIGDIKVQSIFQKFNPERVQFLPVNIIDNKGNILTEEYKVINVLNKYANALDTDKSILRYFDGGIVGADKIVLKQGLPNDLDCFKFEEFLVPLIVSDKFIIEVNSMQIKGVKFSSI